MSTEPVPFLSADWFALRQRLAADLPAQPGATGVAAFEITGAPEGKVRFFERWVDGRIEAIEQGAPPDGEGYAFVVSFKDFKAAAQGDQDPNAGFMQGRWKWSGDMGAMMALQTVTQHRAYRELVRSLDAATTY